MKKQLIVLTIVLFFNPIFAGIEGTLANHLYYSGNIVPINIEIQEEFIGTGTVKICLSNYDFNEGKYSSKCDIPLLTQNVSINNYYLNQLLINLVNIPESLYRLYLQLSYKIDGTTKYKYDRDDGNVILIKTSTLETIKETNNGIILNMITPLTALPNEELTIYVNITNQKDNSKILLYSYIQNKTTYINENLNDDSFKVLNITKGSSAIIIMKNKLIKNITSGTYDYIIKAESGTNIYQTLNTIEILSNQVEENLTNIITCPECKTCEECICETTICPELINDSNVIEEQTSKITAKLNLKRDEYYYIPTILIGIITLVIMYVKLK
ncbi:MAG: hypothetical protein PHN56_00570 [Candidatus Nanoarchaeia archaeon]|nr:hypothetical protein [Candidatus Nanoarchaeia archaeon]